MMKIKYLITLGLVLGLMGSGHAQDFFKAVPRPARASEGAFSARAAIALPDSILNAWRPITNIAAYAYPGNLLMAGAGFGYQHLVYSSTTQRWVCQWSVNVLGFAGGSVAPSTPASVASVGIMGGFDNNLVMIGPSYNFGTKQIGATVSIGINFNN